MGNEPEWKVDKQPAWLVAAIKKTITELPGGYSEAAEWLIDLKHEHWNGNDVQYQYMRPETLFGPKKFEGYLQSGIRWDKKGRPPRESWGEKKHDPMKFGPVDTKIPEGFRG